ncbi:DMT family transporter [Sphingomonas adhaesiva]|uniref:DMT family transporter n=1 Tax=Sphingomonas adhaesiva TaxID=28212 RepID=UPI002FFC80D3
MSQDRILLAVALRLTSVALFAMMSATIKLAQQGGAHLAEILFWRQAGAAILVAAIVAAGPGFASLRTQRFGAHTLRTVIGLTAMALTFTTLILLPLAEATTIGFSMPIFATVLGALVLKEPTGWRRWAAVATGFAGVLIVTQPFGSGHHIPLLGVLTGLTAAGGTATVSILLRTIGRTEKTLTTVFWFSTLSLVPLGIAYAMTAQAHTAAMWATLIAVGLLGGVAQLAMTASLTYGPVSTVVPMDYTSLMWATLLGWLLFDRLPAPATWIGAPVIILSGLYIVWREHVRRREETLQATAQGLV